MNRIIKTKLQWQLSVILSDIKKTDEWINNHNGASFLRKVSKIRKNVEITGD